MNEWQQTRTKRKDPLEMPIPAYYIYKLGRGRGLQIAVSCILGLLMLNLTRQKGFREPQRMPAVMTLRLVSEPIT